MCRYTCVCAMCMPIQRHIWKNVIITQGPLVAWCQWVDSSWLSFWLLWVQVTLGTPLRQSNSAFEGFTTYFMALGFSPTVKNYGKGCKTQIKRGKKKKKDNRRQDHRPYIHSCIVCCGHYTYALCSELTYGQTWDKLLIAHENIIIKDLSVWSQSF